MPVFTGTNSSESLTGGAGNDTLLGLLGNDTLNGGAGIDRMEGSWGNDTYIVDTLADVIVEGSATGTDTVQTFLSYTLGANLENLTLTGATHVIATGNSLDNVLTGNSGNNILDGKAGYDTMAGGLGNDIYILDNEDDVVTEGAAAGIDTVKGTGFSYTLDTNFENLILLGLGNFDLTGNASNNILTGNNGNNILDGQAGADTMTGGAGSDTYYVDNSLDKAIELASGGTDVVFSSASYTLAANLETLFLDAGNINGIGNASNNAISGTTGDNLLNGSSGNDTLDGVSGTDTLIGGLGNDVFYIDDATDVVTEILAQGTDHVFSTASYTLGSNVEHLTLVETFTAYEGTGNTLNNSITGADWQDTLTGLAGNDTLNGGANDDSLVGGLGNDTYYVDSVGDIVVENAAQGTDSIILLSAFSYTLADNFENLTLSASGAADLTGNAANNILTGNADENVLDGLGGVDIMTGGAGNDTYYMDNVLDKANELAGGGTDLVISTVTWTLAPNVENLTLDGSGNLNATGNILNNTLTGNSGNNILTGLAGNDTYYIQNALDKVVEALNQGTDTVVSAINYTLAANVENLTLDDAAGLTGTGNTLNNNIIGNDGNDILSGLVGNDTMDGGLGDDQMTGGTGNDVYYIDSAGDVASENTGEGTDTVISTVNVTLDNNIENLILMGSTALTGTGNAGNNNIASGDGDDFLIGGDGNDNYTVNSALDVVVESAGEGEDTVYTSVSYVLSDNVEYLILTGTDNISGTGNGDDNFILGNNGNNSLDGAGGDDLMAGGLGNDTYYFDSVNDQTSEGFNEGIDTISVGFSYTLGTNIENLVLSSTNNDNGTGNNLNNSIFGNSADNSLSGGLGNDSLTGDLGTDTLNGGKGNDIYVFTDNWGSDLLIDSQGNDTLDLSAVTTSLTVYLGPVEAGYEVSDGINLINWDAPAVLIENAFTGSNDDTVYDNDANNSLSTGDGNDFIFAQGLGNDYFNGGDGDDNYAFYDGFGADTIEDSSGMDTINLSLSSVALTINLASTAGHEVTDGTNTIDWADDVIDYVFSGSGYDIITGNNNNNTISGGGGNDTMDGGSGDDIYIFDAGFGTDVVSDANGTDTLDFSNYNNAFALNLTSGSFATAGPDMVSGFDGSIENVTGSGNNANTLTGSSVNNILVGGTVTDILSGLEGNDTLSGGDGGDSLYGGTGNDSLNGGDGNDWYYFVQNLTENFGYDILVDNGGTDLIDFSDCISSVTINLVSDTNTDEVSIGLGQATINWANDVIDYVIGGSDGDNITGNDNNNYLQGNEGNDTLFGGNGNDILAFGIDNDIVSGGFGDDLYTYALADPASFTIVDYGENDTLDLINYAALSLGDITAWQALDLILTDGLVDTLSITTDDGTTFTIINYFDNTDADVADSGEGTGCIETIMIDDPGDDQLTFAEVQAFFP